MAQGNDQTRGDGAALPRRRRFLIGVGAVAVLGVALGYPLMRRNDAGFIGAKLRARLPDLRIEQDELALFARDFLAFYKDRNPLTRGVFLWGTRTLWTYLPGGGRALLSRVLADPYSRFERELLEAFLMGTDYLQSRRDPAAKVTYSNMPDPYEYGCTNTLARFD